jgi:hypothetical protein
MWLVGRTPSAPPDPSVDRPNKWDSLEAEDLNKRTMLPTDLGRASGPSFVGAPNAAPSSLPVRSNIP